MQDENTRYVCIGPVNKVINMLCCWLEDPNSEAFKRYLLLYVAFQASVAIPLLFDDSGLCFRQHDVLPQMCCHCRHIPRLYDFLWVAEDGMKMQGYNGSQLWDTTFAVQAICASGLCKEFTDCLRKAEHYIDVTQVRSCALCSVQHRTM